MTRPATGSLWAATGAPMAPLPQLSGQGRAEIVVIGAGYTGLSAALHAAAAGRDVAVLEAGRIGEGGSGLNGGQVIAGLKHDPQVLESLYGERIGAQLTACSGSAPELVFELIRRYSIDCDAVRTGWLQLAVGERHLELIERRGKGRGTDSLQFKRHGPDFLP